MTEARTIRPLPLALMALTAISAALLVFYAWGGRDAQAQAHVHGHSASPAAHLA